MKQKEFADYASALLHIYKDKYPQFHCEKNYCCGICDRFYPCLLDILDKVKKYSLDQRKELEQKGRV